LVSCELGYRHRTFVADGLPYALHYDPDDAPKWREIENASIALFDDVSHGGKAKAD
jgi:hypothetical protein